MRLNQSVAGKPPATSTFFAVFTFKFKLSSPWSSTFRRSPPPKQDRRRQRQRRRRRAPPSDEDGGPYPPETTERSQWYRRRAQAKLLFDVVEAVLINFFVYHCFVFFFFALFVRRLETRWYCVQHLLLQSERFLPCNDFVSNKKGVTESAR